MAPPGTRAKDTASARLAMAYEDFLSWAREHKSGVSKSHVTEIL